MDIKSLWQKLGQIAEATDLKSIPEEKKKKPDADGDGVPDWADKKPGEDDNEDKEKVEEGIGADDSELISKLKQMILNVARRMDVDVEAKKINIERLVRELLEIYNEYEPSDEEEYRRTNSLLANKIRAELSEESMAEEAPELKNIKHFAKAGGYGRKIDTPDDSGDKFHSSDIDDSDDAPQADATVKRGRGRPMKGGDSETGQVKNYDTDALASWIIGNKPKNLDKIGKVSHVHRLKEYMSQVESNKLFESVVTEGKMSEIAEFLQELDDHNIDLAAIISGEYQPVDAVERFVVDKLKKKYEEYTSNGDQDAIESIYDELGDILSGSQPLEEVMATSVQPAGQPAQSGQPAQTAQSAQKQPVPIRVNGQVVGTAPDQATAQQATQKMTQNANNQKELAKMGVSSLNESAESKYQMVMEGLSLQEILDLHPHEHKMCQEGWGMDESLYEALCDHYFKEGRIPHKVWHGPLDQLRDHVEECYMQDTGAVMDETAPITNVIDATYASPGVDEAALRADDHAMSGLEKEIDEEFDAIMKNSGIPREPIRGFVPPEEESVFSKSAMMKSALNESKSEKKPDQQWRNSLVTSKTVNAKESISQDDFDKAALAQGKRGRDARDNPSHAVAMAKKSPASQEAGAKVAAYKAKHDEPVKKLDELSKDTMKSYVKKAEAEYGKSPNEPAVKLPKDVHASAVKHREGIKKAKGKLSNLEEKDEGKHNNATTGFKALAKKAAKEYGSKAAGERVAGAVHAKMKKAGQLEEGKFGQMDADLADLSPAEFKKEYGMTKAEARAKHGAKQPVKETAKPDYIDLDGDGNKKETMKKAAADKKSKNLKEMDGQSRGRDNDDIGKKEYTAKPQKAKDAAKDAGDELNKAFSKATPKKTVKESADYSLWDQQLNSLLNEDLTVNTTSSSNPDSNSVNVSATAEDADHLMALLKNAGMGADSGATQAYEPEDTGACAPGEMDIEVAADDEEGNAIADIVKRMMGAQGGETDYAVEVMEDFEPNIYNAAEDSYQKDDGAVKQTKTTAKGQDGETYDGTGSPALTTKSPGSDAHNKFHDASDVPVMAMPRGMGVSQNVEDEVAEVVEPIFIDEVIDGLENEDTPDNGDSALDYIKKSVPGSQEKKSEPAAEKSESDDSEEVKEDQGDGNLANNAKPYDKVTQGDVIAGRLGKDEKGGKEEVDEDGVPPTASSDSSVTTMSNGDNDEEQSEENSDATRDAALATMQPMGATNECEDEPTRERESLADFMKRLDAIVGKHPSKHEQLDEWANSANDKGTDESFETDMEFMTRSISGGLNNQKQDQTLVGSGPNRVITQDERKEVDNTMGAMLKKLDGING